MYRVLFRGYERDDPFAGEVLLAPCVERRKAGSIALRRHEGRLRALLGQAFGKWRPHVELPGITERSPQLTVDEIGAAGILSPGAELIAREQPIDDGLDRRRLVMRKELPRSWSLHCRRRTVKRLPRQGSRISSGHSARQVSDRKRAGGRSQKLSSRVSRHSGPSNDLWPDTDQRERTGQLIVARRFLLRRIEAPSDRRNDGRQELTVPDFQPI
jgi:hypothetical protein